MPPPLLIGQAPGPKTDPLLPLYPLPRTSAGGRLLALTGLRRGRYLQVFDRVNLLHEFPGKHKRDDKWPAAPTRFAAQTMRPFLTGRHVVLVGRNVANAFRLDMPFHEWGWMECRRANVFNGCNGLCQVAIIPHTSGRNHWYNNEANMEMALNFWQRLVKELI